MIESIGMKIHFDFSCMKIKLGYSDVMHGIIKPVDQVFSTKCPEWHRLADVVPFIDDSLVKRLCHRIIQGSVYTGGKSIAADLKFAVETLKAHIEGKRNVFYKDELQAVYNIVSGVSLSEMPHHQALVADLRDSRPELRGTEHELVPLHIPKKRYQPIENCQVWDAVKRSLVGVDAEVTCVGTLFEAKKFFISVELKDESNMEIRVKRTFGVEKEKFYANLNFITSHDGTLAAQAYDSMIRIVCMNTLMASLEAAGSVGFNVYHTKGAEVAIANMGELINAILKGRVQFRDAMEYLSTVAVSAAEAQEIILGYFLKFQGNDEAAKKTVNATEEIVNLFLRGKGNRGESYYDLLNGATEYWTHGDGTGKKANVAEKATKAAFGAAAEHKARFFNLLMSGKDAIAEVREIGKKGLSLAV